MRVADFLDTLGVNTHIDSPPYDSTARIMASLAYIGITNVRQTSPIDAGSAAGMLALGQAGAKIDLVINGGGPVNLAGAMQNVYTLAPYLNAVENVNEAAIYPIQYAGRSGVDAAVALQKDLYAAVRADPALANAPVYSFTIGGADPSAYPSIGDISAYTDFANIHTYPPHGLRPIFVIHAAIDGGRTDAPSKPVVITETGYYTLQNSVGWGGVPQSVQASYLLNEVLDEAAAGVRRTYLYDLLDDGADPNGVNQEDHFGLFNVDGTPKLAATAFHNLTTILADPGAAAASFTPSAFTFSADGVPYNYTGNTLELDKSDGSHIVAVWNEEQLWNTDTLTAIAAQHYATTVNLNATYQEVLVFDPTVGTAPIQVYHNVSQVSLDLTDHPFLVQVIPAPPVLATPQPPQTPVVAAVPMVDNPPAVVVDTLVIEVSEDAYKGDAQFTVTVDGQAVGGVLTASALHGQGQTQDIVLTGSFGSNSRAVGVSFLNDLWDGTPATDRNLYVDGMTLNGTAVANSSRALYSQSNATVDVGAPKQVEVAFNLSEDAWQGDAQAVIRIDGQTIGTPTVVASHGAGNTQRLSFMTALSAGPHTASVSFVNDAWGGTPDTDRNLYVDSVQVAGTTLPGSSGTLFTFGALSFSLPDTTTTTSAALQISQGLVHHI